MDRLASRSLKLPPTPPGGEMMLNGGDDAQPPVDATHRPHVPSLLNLRKNTAGFSLKDELVKGLADGRPLVTPGNTDADTRFRWSREISTLSLYSDAGLAIYDDITKLKEYYVFPAELEILIRYGDEIACRMFGLPTQSLSEYFLKHPLGGGPNAEINGTRVPTVECAAPKERWGDESVGVNNQGVNGGLGMGEARIGLAVELGSGSLEKTRHLLASMSKLLKPSQHCPFERIEYQALDVEQKSLEDTLIKLVRDESKHVAPAPDGTPRVVASGIVATYDEGLAHLASINGDGLRTQKSLLWLGSSIGNFNRQEAKDFLKNISDNVLKPGDTMVIGIDNCDNGPMIETAYNDPHGVTRDFILEGVNHAGRVLHGTLASGGGLAAKNFEYVSRWNASVGRHEAYVRCKVDNLVIPIPATSSAPAHEVVLKKDELLAIEVSYKYTQAEAAALFNGAGLRLVQQWTDSRRLHSIYVLEKPPFLFPFTKALGSPINENPYGIPSLTEWETMWQYWDLLTTKIIPRDLLMTKPIPLRHIILFYTGHIPAFAGIHLSRYFKEPLTEPAHYAEIFERGIDPNVEDPTKITHSHSIVPSKDEDWPSLESIHEYQEKIRSRIRRVYTEEKGRMTSRLARVMFLIFEHEAMHAETLIYIALQATHLNPAPGFVKPDFRSLGAFWDRLVEAEEDERDASIRFDATSIVVGHDDDDRFDDETPYDAAHELGWDVEHPRRELQVPAFDISASPITNGQYLGWLKSLDDAPANLFLSSWKMSKPALDGVIAVKTLYGPVPIEYAKHWPAVGSAYQLSAYAKAHGGRLPTRGELAIWHRQNPPDSVLSNVGFTNLHPVPATLPHKQRDGSIGLGSDGGVWMWSQDKLEPHDGYIASSLYPGYSSDFFDDTHQLILGGSYATPPRLARATFVNWYQTTYPYTIAGARIVYDQ